MFKKFFCALALAALCTGSAFADEGMWLLPLLQKINADNMRNAGLRILPEEIYSINHSSLKDAVVQFGGGCTGEVVSAEGLLLTNHHCGYSSIQKLSSVEHNYLEEGYWAMNRNEELPVEGLSVTFLQYMTDVTSAINKAVDKVKRDCRDKSKLEEEMQKERQLVENELIKNAKQNNPNCDAYIQPFYNENVYYLVVSKTYRDVRFVGAPPSSIGKFGADTDNWMWPRHTCDFSMFRIYANKNNEPATYSEDNVPYIPKQSLKISLKGVKEGDYAMIIGYPGRTQRFQSSSELMHMIEMNDVKIAARTVRQDVLLEDMLTEPAVKIKYASKYSSSSNGWKKWQGMKQAFENLGIIERTKKDEAEFLTWCKANPKVRAKYMPSLDSLKSGVDAMAGSDREYTLLSETIFRIELMNAAGKIVKQDKTDEAFYKDYSASTDRKVAKAMLKHYRENTSGAYPIEIDGFDFQTMDIDAYVDLLFDGSAFTSKEGSDSILHIEGAAQEDMAYKLYDAFKKSMLAASADVDKSNGTMNDARKLYTEGKLAWKKGMPTYPDANFSMRLSYGKVLSYSPKDAILYKHYSTLKGVMEKEDPDNWEFVVPQKLKDIYNAKDFGEYAMKSGEMPACFLTNNDITGGNSGSPVLNSRGELLGLAFDGNWEAMSGDVMFEPELQRCINVDIRYVLLIIDKFGGAGYLLNEMELIR